MNRVYAIMGPPASGKSAIVKEVCRYGVKEMISHTTRKPERGEQNGVDYYFVTEEELSKIQLVERIQYSGYYYALSKDEVMKTVKQCPVSVVAVDRHGMTQMKKIMGERVTSIYIMVDKATIIERITEQGGNLEQMKRRIEYAEKEGEFDDWKIADHVVKNTGSLELAARQVLAIMGLVLPTVPAKA
ncbi:MAG TPA: guanylate kinase [Patescibacteria group bacterium]|nr:guanylate kinase [Patescibacteria group bacterium]